jgi:hypothetical protein
MNKLELPSENVNTPEQNNRSPYIKSLVAYFIGILIAATTELILVAAFGPLTSGHPSGLTVLFILFYSSFPSVLTTWIPMILGQRIYIKRSPLWGILFGMIAIASSAFSVLIFMKILTWKFFLIIGLVGFIMAEFTNFAIYYYNKENK